MRPRHDFMISQITSCPSVRRTPARRSWGCAVAAIDATRLMSNMHTKLQSDCPNAVPARQQLCRPRVKGRFTCCRGESCWAHAAAYGHYEIAFWATVLNLISAAVAVFAAVRDPSWYMARRAPGLSFGLDAEDEIITIVASKAVLILLSSVLGRYMGKWAGYF